MLPDIEDFFEGALVFAHNLSFDARLLRQSAEAAGHSIVVNGLCTVRLARRVHPERKGRGAHSLAGLASLYGLQNLRRMPWVTPKPRPAFWGVSWSAHRKW